MVYFYVRLAKCLCKKSTSESDLIYITWNATISHAIIHFTNKFLLTGNKKDRKKKLILINIDNLPTIKTIPSEIISLFQVMFIHPNEACFFNIIRNIFF